MLDVVISLKELQSSVEYFLASLYCKKHAFYFRMVKQWVECFSVSVGTASYHILIPYSSKNGMKGILGKSDLLIDYLSADTDSWSSTSTSRPASWVSRIYTLHTLSRAGKYNDWRKRGRRVRKPNATEETFTNVGGGNVIEEMKTFGKEGEVLCLFS